MKFFPNALPILASALVLSVLPFQIHALDASKTTSNGVTQAQSVKIQPRPMGLLGLPSRVYHWESALSISHEPENIFQVRVLAKEPVVLGLIGKSTEDGEEIFPNRLIEPSDEPQWVRWALDQRIGTAPSIASFVVCAGSFEHAKEEIVLDNFQVLDAKELSDEELIAASAYQPLTLRYSHPNKQLTTQEVFACLPREVARRHVGGKLVITVNGESKKEVLISDASSGERKLFTQKISIPMSEFSGSEQSIGLILEKTDGSKIDLGTQEFRFRSTNDSFQEFEMPLQSVDSFVAFKTGPDLRLVVSTVDLFTRPEPQGARTQVHEMHDVTLSVMSGLFDSEVFWRLPAFGHWASAGFRSLGLGSIRNNHAIWATAAGSDGIEVVANAATVNGTPIRPFVNNPVYFPAPEFSDWEEGQTRVVRGNGVVPYGRSWMMANISQVNNNPPRMIAALTSDMRQLSDAGPLPIELPDGVTHLSFAKHENWSYLLTDDPHTVWVSHDPLRFWEQKSVDFPEDWFQFRIVAIDGIDQLFGLATVNGKNVVRWQELEWVEERKEAPMPKLSAATNSGSGDE